MLDKMNKTLVDNDLLEEREALIAELVDVLSNYVIEYPAFRSMTVGCPNSAVRAEQERQIDLENKARAILAKAKGAA